MYFGKILVFYLYRLGGILFFLGDLSFFSLFFIGCFWEDEFFKRFSSNCFIYCKVTLFLYGGSRLIYGSDLRVIGFIDKED